MTGVIAIQSLETLEAKTLKSDTDFTNRLLDIWVNDGKHVDTYDPESFRQTRDAIDHKDGLSADKKRELKERIDDLEATVSKRNAKGVAHVQNEEEMKALLSELKKEGRLPVLVGMDTRNEPFWSASGAGAAGGSGGGHLITITDFDRATGMAKMQNQWRGENNHDISVRDPFKATRSGRDNLSDLENELKDVKTHDPTTAQKEYKLPDLKFATGKIGKADMTKLLPNFLLRCTSTRNLEAQTGTIQTTCAPLQWLRVCLTELVMLILSEPTLYRDAFSTASVRSERYPHGDSPTIHVTAY